MYTFSQQNHQSPQNGSAVETIGMKKVRQSNPQPGGQTNYAYELSSPDDISRSPPMRQSQNGHSGRDNAAYVSSVYCIDTPDILGNNNSSPSHNGIPPKDSISHNPNRYINEETKRDKEAKYCVPRGCRIAIIVIVVVLLIGAGVVLGLFFGTDLLQPSQTTVSPSTVSEPATPTLQTTTFIYGGPSSSPVTSTETPQPDGDTFSGQLTLNQIWTPDLANSSSDAFQNISNAFATWMDSEMSSSQSFGSYYNRTEVLSLLNGSIIVVFRMVFNEPVVRNQVIVEVNEIIETGDSSSGLEIVEDSLVVTDFEEATACGTEDLMLCDGKCRLRSEIACNDIKHCSDYYDEANCPGESVTCNFEQPAPCGYTLHRSSGYKWVYNSGDTATSGTGPQYDHTYMNFTGHYYYTDWCQSCDHGAICRMTSPWYVTRESACLSFYYSMKGHPTEMGPLYVYSLNHINEEKLLWTRENPEDEFLSVDWRQVKVNIPAGSYQFIFSSFLDKGSELGDKAIDDILVQTGECTELPVCEETLYCASTGQCIPPLEKPLCNGKFDCPDESDEQNCPGMLHSSSFESGANLSSYSLTTMSSGTPYYSWTILDGPTADASPGTYFDYTFKNELGHYATAIPVLIPTGTETTLKIETVLPPYEDICLQFAYQMNYEGSVAETTGTLKVNGRNVATGEAFLLWSQDSSTGRDWIHESYSIPVANQSYQLEFVAVRGDGDGIVISVDDITVMDGFCPCADPGRRQCPDRTCIPEEWFCDGEDDCANGADEISCPACGAGETQCRDKSCVPGGDSIICDGMYDCADGSDEDACAVVDQCETEECIRLKHPDGLFEVCASTWSETLNDQVCTYLYKGPAISSEATQAVPSSVQFLSLNPSDGVGFISRFNKVNSCPSNAVIKVTCEDSVCGRRSPNISPYIIGGTETTVQGRWPWLVELKYRGIHICGGTLLTPNWIVTAAHCVSRGRENEPESLSVSLGTTQVAPGQDNSVRMRVTRVVLNSDYVNVYGGSDIALLFVEQAINYTDFIKPACLADSQDLYDYRSYCFLTGWGKIELPDEYPDKLQEAKYKLRPYDSCNTTWSGVIRDNMVCAGYHSGTIRSCQGDSGGPLICLDKYQRWSLVGITSFGPAGCLLENHGDDVFTRASQFSKWIDDIVNFEFNCNNNKVITDAEKLCDGVDDCGDNSDEIVTCTRSVECSFEARNYCGYTLGGWSVASGLASASGSLLNTGPSFDHTSGLADGKHKYVYAEVNGATLTSASHSSSSESCLQLYYYLSYDSKIVIRQLAGSVISEVSGAADHWQIAQISLPAGDYSLVFEAVISEPSYVAIDDVTVAAGACSGSCPPGTIKCQAGFACIRSEDVCDGVAQCADASDESNCGSIEQVQCSFDEAYACGFQQSNSDSANWNIQYQLTGSVVGPSTGHQEDADDRDYSYLIAVASESYAMASVRWPLRVSTQSCMTFWYYMYGTNGGTISVWSDGLPVWQEIGGDGEEWKRVDVTSEAGNMVEFRAQSGVQDSNYVAIDDIMVAKGACPSPPPCDAASEIRCYDKCLNNSKRCDRTVDCFDLSDEASCNWLVDCDFSASCNSYLVTSSIGLYYWERRTVGDYLSVAVVNGQRGSRTEYTSAPFLLTETQCLTFKYQLQGSADGNPEMRVVLNEPVIGRDTILWRMSAEAASWTNARVTLSPVDQMTVTLSFQAFYGGNSDATLSLDDIQLAAGPCSSPVCSDGFLCPYEEMCIPAAQKCDGVAHCQGSLDELNCGELADTIDCNFDEDFCHWTSSTSGLRLLRNAGSTPLVNTGPTYDNTLRNWLGYYIYLDSTEVPGEARLTSPAIQLTTEHCLSFHYYMTGGDIGSLNLTSSHSSTAQTLLNIDSTLGSAIWHRAQISLSAADAMTLQFIFTSKGLFSNIAIDDITLRAGACDCSEGFKCTQSGECFDSFVACDFRAQCIDGSDEENCEAVCPDNDLRCEHDGQCYPVDLICTDLSLRNCISLDEQIDCHCNSTYEDSCPQGFCYDKQQFCDGVGQCPDGSDEPSRCGENCPAGHVTCKDLSQCVLNDFWCDGYEPADCNDGSDEEPGCVPVVSAAPAPDCSGNNFICHNQTQVLSRNKYCDGKIDCNDGSDEPVECDCCPDEWRCNSGDRCISLISNCDAVYDCPDFSDELSCNCSEHQFRCDGGLCLDKKVLCDGSLDCNDWSDETNCNCSASEFKCANGRCILADLKCNNRDDCLDNSDEFDCPCSSDEVKCELGTDRRCILKEWQCDGFIDCHNGTDEDSCGNCPEYSCTDYTCISHSSVCDGTAQCSDGKDERSCFDQSANLMINVLLSNGQTTNNYTLCYDDWRADWSSSLCMELGHKHAISTRIIPVDGLQGPWVKFNSTDSNLQLSKFQRVQLCESSYALAVECQPKGCGESTKLRVTPYLIGGDIVQSATEWPWMVAIYFAGEFAGAGVHIGDGWLVTAAHLVRVQHLQNGALITERRDTNPELFQVETISPQRGHSNRTNVGKIIVHSQFANTPGLRNDIAMFKLATDPVYPSVCIDQLSDMASLCYVAGWGSVDGQDVAVSALRDVRMDILSDTQCVSQWNAGGYFIFYSSTMLCAGGDDQPSTCFGDSGGPLMCADPHTGNWFLKGIVSFGESNCLLSHKANVFTEVAFFQNWIKESMQTSVVI